MKPKCPDCGAELVKVPLTIADWYCNLCDAVYDVEEVDWGDGQDESDTR